MMNEPLNKIEDKVRNHLFVFTDQHGGRELRYEHCLQSVACPLGVVAPTINIADIAYHL